CEDTTLSGGVWGAVVASGQKRRLKHVHSSLSFMPCLHDVLSCEPGNCREGVPHHSVVRVLADAKHLCPVAVAALRCPCQAAISCGEAVLSQSEDGNSALRHLPEHSSGWSIQPSEAEDSALFLPCVCVEHH